MKRITKICAPAVLLVSLVGISSAVVDEIQEFRVDKTLKVLQAPAGARKDWHSDRFGMFVHWGPISQMGEALSHSRNSPSHHPGGCPYKVAKIPPEVYDVQYKTFNPTNYNPDAIAKLAKKAGANYVVFTAKHCAGFSMFDSAYIDYDIMSAPYRKDILKMLSDACRDNGVNFGIYYSPRDWRHPDCDSANHHDRYIRFFKNQMGELLTKYGPIYEVWFDGLGPGKWGNTCREVMEMVRKTNPNAMVNNRGGSAGDFYTPEQSISYFNRERLWEACYTTTGQWGYNPRIGARSLSDLMEILLYCWGSDGNMLLNIGPRGDGSLRPVTIRRWQQIAEWWQKNGEESIRGSFGGPYLPGLWGAATCKGNNVYLHIFRHPEAGGIFFPDLPGLKLQKATMMDGRTVKVELAEHGFKLTPPAYGEISTTVRLRFSGDTTGVKPLPRVPSLTTLAKLSASGNSKDLEKLRDQNAETYWIVNGDRKGKMTSEFLLTLEFEEPQTIAGFYIARGERWSPRVALEVQVPDGSGGWQTISSKRLKLTHVPIKRLDHPVTTRRLRLRVTNCWRFICAEFEVYAPVE